MSACVRAEFVWKLRLQVRPASGKVSVVVAVRRVRNVVGLADVCGFGVGFTIAWMITQRFHANLAALLHHDVVVVAT